jgi:hypothetical protein
LASGGTREFTATVDNDPANNGVVWAVTGGGCAGAACGAISPAMSASGAKVTYTAPVTVPANTNVTISATSVSDETKSASSTVTLGAIGIAVSPASATVMVNGTQALIATVANDPVKQGVTWTVTGTGCTGTDCGTISPTISDSGDQVTFAAPANLPSPAIVTATATSVADNTKSGVATITLTRPPVSVSVDPVTATVAVNTTQDFVATLLNDPNDKGVTWTVSGVGCSGPACGTITPGSSASGAAVTYTAPATVPNPADVIVTATSNAETGGTASATVTVSSLVSVDVTPTFVGVDVNTARQFTATVAHDASHSGVIWKVTGSSCPSATCGTVSPVATASGEAVTYTAPSVMPVRPLVTLTATAVANYTATASADVAITAPGAVTVAVLPTGATISTAGTSRARQFRAHVFHDAGNSGVIWTVPTGTISPTASDSGVPVTYTAPQNSSGSTIVRATSAADVTRFGTANVQLINSCPLVYSWDGTNWRLDSGTFGGAIVRALARTDVDNLDFVIAQDSVLRLRLANELNETEYVDKLAVLAVDHDSGTTVAPDGTGGLHSVGPLTLPMRARDVQGNDVLTQVSAADGRSWQSSVTSRDTAVTADIRDGIELTFPKPTGVTTARLVLDGNNTPWAALMMYAFVDAHGRATQAWYDSLDAEPERARRMFATLAREAFLSVSVWTGGGWRRQGLVWEAPPEVVKRQVLSLDLRRVSGNTVRVRLESVPSFWALDQVTLDYSPEHPVIATELNPSSAIDGRGQDVLEPLAAADSQFFTMEQDDFAEVRYRVPEIPAGRVRTYLLASTGWYRIHTPEVAEPDVTFLQRVLTEPRAISRLSVARMNEELRVVEASAR